MARHVRRSRRPLLPEQPNPFDFVVMNNDGIQVRRSGPRRRVINRVVQRVYWYGFLTDIGGDELGPWILEFECTDAHWFNDIVEHRMPPHYDLQRLRAQIGNNDYWTAWERSIGGRVVLRRFYEHYRDLAGSSANPAPLATYVVALDGEDIDRRVIMAGDGVQREIRTGYWYGLILTPAPAPLYALDYETGILTKADPQTDRLGQPEPCRLLTLQLLQSHPRPPRGFGEPRFEGMFHSQAVLQALHHARGE